MTEYEQDPNINRTTEEVREQLKDLGIKAVLFDLDDTLIFTTEIFAKYMKEYVEKVAEETGLEFAIIDEALRRLNDAEFKRVGVNPARWETVVQKMAEELPEKRGAIVNNLGILMNIYIDEPRVRVGAKETIEALKAAGVKVGLITHANVDWTWRKLTSSGLIDCFDTIVIADENGHKGVQHWQEAMNNLEVLPNECLVVGDNLGGDIIPTAKIGARTMWLHKGSTWSLYRTGEVPETTITIDEVNELLPALERLR